MNILLINPPWKVQNEENMWSKVASCYPSLGIAYIASVLEKNGHSVRILDLHAEYISLDNFKKMISEGYCDKFDYVGITATTPLINNSFRIAKDIKERKSSIKIVLGGVHPSVLPEETLSNPNVDIVVKNEGEYTMLDIADGRDLTDIPGICYKDPDGKIHHNPPRGFIENLDELPLPAYHLMPIDKYRPPVGGYKRLPAMSIFATRGCPGRCTFCFRLFEGKIRYRSAKKIVEEIKYLQKHYGIKEISFYDDTFTAIKQNVRDFCNIVLNEKIDITWSCFTRVNYVDEEIFALMKKAGCHLVLFGVESGDQKILDGMNKLINLDQVKKAVKICKRIGLETRASYIFGALGETKETMEKTLNFAIELDTDTAQFNIMTAYPGTQLWDQLKERGYLRVDNYDYSMSDFSMELPTVSNEEIAKMYKKAHRKYYLRPKIILRRLFRIRSFEQLKQEIKGAMAVTS